MFVKEEYRSLNSKQRENYNFHQLAAVLADYGYNSLRLSNDWQGADFIACHINGVSFLKIQLKGRLTVAKRYRNKDIHVAFPLGKDWYVFDHDAFLNFAEQNLKVTEESKRWREAGERRWGKPPKWALEFLDQYRVQCS